MFKCQYPAQGMSQLEAISRVRATTLSEFRELEAKSEENRQRMLQIQADLEREIARLQAQALSELQALSRQQAEIALKQDSLRSVLSKVGVQRVPKQ